MATRSLCKVKLMRHDWLIVQGSHSCHRRNRFRMYRMHCYMLNRVHRDHTNEHEHLLCAGLLLHVFEQIH